MRSREFDEVVLPHLDAAYNYARWLTRNDTEAEDVVQDAFVRALRFLPSLRDDDARPWLFAIVRNAWYSRAARRAGSPDRLPLETARYDPIDRAPDPEARLLRQHAVARIRDALERLPPDFREVLVLREFEEMSYKEIASVVDVPIGTVMSRLARARERLSTLLDSSPLPMERRR
jgi:RNA polymerase sigma-70 factor (ECF subfamily)